MQYIWWVSSYTLQQLKHIYIQKLQKISLFLHVLFLKKLSYCSNNNDYLQGLLSGNAIGYPNVKALWSVMKKVNVLIGEISSFLLQ